MPASICRTCYISNFGKFALISHGGMGHISNNITDKIMLYTGI